jgi:hypothetical protein
MDFSFGKIISSKLFLNFLIVEMIIIVIVLENMDLKNVKKSNMNTEKVTRIEVIDHQSEPMIGRAYTKWNCEKVELSLQDDERTLKIFISSKKELFCDEAKSNLKEKNL